MIRALIKRYHAWKCRTGRHKFDEQPIQLVDGRFSMAGTRHVCPHCRASFVTWGAPK